MTNNEVFNVNEIFDGCESIDKIIEMLNEYIDYFINLKEMGCELTDIVECGNIQINIPDDIEIESEDDLSQSQNDDDEL